MEPNVMLDAHVLLKTGFRMRGYHLVHLFRGLSSAGHVHSASPWMLCTRCTVAHGLMTEADVASFSDDVQLC